MDGGDAEESLITEEATSGVGFKYFNRTFILFFKKCDLKRY